MILLSAMLMSIRRKELGWTAKRGIVDMCRDAWRFEVMRDSIAQVAGTSDR